MINVHVYSWFWIMARALMPRNEPRVESRASGCWCNESGWIALGVRLAHNAAHPHRRLVLRIRGL